jgi:hypothetical protein
MAASSPDAPSSSPTSLRSARAVPPAARSTFGKGGVSEENSPLDGQPGERQGLWAWRILVADRAHPGGLTAAAPDDDLGRAAADAADRHAFAFQSHAVDGAAWAPSA